MQHVKIDYKKQLKQLGDWVSPVNTIRILYRSRYCKDSISFSSYVQRQSNCMSFRKREHKLCRIVSYLDCRS